MTKNIDIPDGWKVKKLGEVAEIYRGASPRPIAKYLTDSSLGIPWIKIGDINPNDKYITTTKEKITQDGAKHSKIIHSGYFILSNSMSIGRPYISKITGCIHDGWLSINNYERNINIDYLYYALNSQYIKKSFANNASLGTVTNLNSDIVKNTHILLPPLAEQEKIAEILSLWDKAIEQTKELIAYKEKQKKGLMQNLLTGKKRLHGFTDKCKTYIVKELGLVITGKTPNTEKKEYYGDEFLFITPTDIHYKYTTKTERNLSKSGLNKSKLIPKNSVLITCIASIGKNTINKSDCAINQQINAIVPNNNFYYEYIYYYMTFNSPYLLKFAGKSATSIINKTTFEEIDVTIPPLDEQKAIADILCKADEEIELLKKQLDLYTEQKKGLMQNLLTGKVRVTV